MQSPRQMSYLYPMMIDPLTTVAFTGHRSYCGEAAAALHATVEELYARGMRTFLSGMAMGFDLAAAEAVIEARTQRPGLRLVAVVPFRDQAARFPREEAARFERVLGAADQVVVLSECYHRACYAVRNDFLIDHAATLVAWYDGSPGGTHYTVRRAMRRHRTVCNLADTALQPRPGMLF